MANPIRIIDIWSEPCPKCGKTHEMHYQRNGKTTCEDGTLLGRRYPYNQVELFRCIICHKLVVWGEVGSEHMDCFFAAINVSEKR